MIARRHIGAGTEVAWATPTSGYGHVADEQPLPYIHRDGLELTPRFGGEESLPTCAPETAGLPRGILAEGWPTRQRLFNVTRRSANLYWRNLFRSRTPADRRFLFLHQLDFRPRDDGFVGACPLLRLERRFLVGAQAVEVRDTVTFERPVRFSSLDLVVVPLFGDWAVGDDGPRRLECAGFRLARGQPQQSSAGSATLWVERLERPSFEAGERVERRYTYRWE